MRYLLLATTLLLLPLTGTAIANPVISCHCFQERAYDPARPQIADPYLLATTQNTFMAVLFDLPKKELVQAKMSGTSADHLWVAHYLASEHATPPAPLLKARQRSDSWRQALRTMNFGTLRAGEPFAALLHKEAADPFLAAAAADEMLVERLGADPGELARLRFRGADTARVILSSLLAVKSGRSALDIHDDFSSGRQSWGQMFDALGLLPGAPLEEELRRLLRRGGDGASRAR